MCSLSKVSERSTLVRHFSMALDRVPSGTTVSQYIRSLTLIRVSLLTLTLMVPPIRSVPVVFEHELGIECRIRRPFDRRTMPLTVHVHAAVCLRGARHHVTVTAVVARFWLVW